MKILHKYVLKEHFGPLVFALTALTSLLLLQYIAKRFGELVGKGLPPGIIAEFLGLSVPLTLALSMPMAVLVATLYAFSRLASENEITAMKAGGVSMRSVLTPVLWAAAGVTLFMVGFNDQVLPRANHKLRSLQSDIAQKKPTFGLREQVINEVSPGKLYLRAGHISKTSNQMREVTIYDLADATRRRTVYADSGNMTMTPNQADLQLTLYSGVVQDVPTESPEELQRLYFQTELYRIRNVGNEFRKTTNDTYKGEREMSVCEMELKSSVARHEFANARKEYLDYLAQARKRRIQLSDEVLRTRTSEPLSIGLGRAYCALLANVGVRELGAQIRPGTPATDPQRVRARPDSIGTTSDAVRFDVSDDAFPSVMESLRLRVMETRNSISTYEVEIHKKFAIAAACFVFVLLGAPIALRFPRAGVGLTIGVSLIVFALYYVGLIAGESLARRGMVPPMLSMWGANIIFTLVALVLLARMGSEKASSRSSTFGDAWFRLLTRSRGPSAVEVSRAAAAGTEPT